MGSEMCIRDRFDQRVIPYHIDVEYYIELHLKFPKWKDFIETLAHEMVHVRQVLARQGIDEIEAEKIGKEIAEKRLTMTPKI